MKKILLFSHLAHADWISGAEKSLLFLTSLLVQQDHHIKVISPQSGVLTRQLQRLGIDVGITSYKSCVWEMMDPQPGFRQRLESVKREERERLQPLYQILHSFQPDCVVVNTIVNVMAAFVAKSMGARVVWFIREPIVEGQLQKESALLVISLADQLVVNSRAVLEMFISFGAAEKVMYLPNAVDPSKLQKDQWPEFRRRVRDALGISNHQCLVGFFGALSQEKGVEEFIRMAAKIGRLAPETVFCLTGKEGNLKRLKMLIMEVAKSVPVHFLGFWDNINALLPALDVVVLPSIVAEGCPRAAIEAMAFGKPVVAYRVGGMMDLIRDGQTGYLVPLKDRAALAESVLHLVRNDSKRNEFGEAARRVVESDYHINGYKEKVISIFDK